MERGQARNEYSDNNGRPDYGRSSPAWDSNRDASATKAEEVHEGPVTCTVCHVSRTTWAQVASSRRALPRSAPSIDQRRWVLARKHRAHAGTPSDGAPNAATSRGSARWRDHKAETEGSRRVRTGGSEHASERGGKPLRDDDGEEATLFYLGERTPGETTLGIVRGEQGRAATTIRWGLPTARGYPQGSCSDTSVRRPRSARRPSGTRQDHAGASCRWMNGSNEERDQAHAGAPVVRGAEAVIQVRSCPKEPSLLETTSERQIPGGVSP